MNVFVRNLLFALLAVGAIAAAGGQAPAPVQKEAEVPAVEATPAPTPAPKPTPTAAAEEQLEEFVPTEKVPADQGAAFPVDI